MGGGNLPLLCYLCAHFFTIKFILDLTRMKKTKLFLLGAILASFSFSATAQTAEDEAFTPGSLPAYEKYPDNKDSKNTKPRKLTSFKLTNTIGGDALLKEPKFNVDQSTDQNSTLYYNLLDSAWFAPFQTRAGNTVTFTPEWNDGWMHAYLFIDYNRDLPNGGGFNSKLNNSTNKSFSTAFNNALNPSANGELVAFSAYQISTGWVNSNGDTASDGAGIALPAFTIPDLPLGTYDALYKIDWNNISQHGSDQLGISGGVVVRFQIEVVAHKEYEVTVNSSDDEKGSVKLRVDGQDEGKSTSAFTNQTVVAVATPAANHYFHNWTDDATGEVVSKASEYSFVLSGNLSLTANFLNQEEYDALDEQFDPANISSTYNHSERKLNNFTLTNTSGNDGSLNEPTFEVNQTTTKNLPIYFDLRKTTAPFQTKAGNTVTLTPNWSGSSMHGYVFIDYNKDGGFNSNFNNSKKDTYSEGFIQSLNASAEGELVAFSAYQVSGSYKNSDEDDVAGNVGVNPPSFKIPENLPLGIYDALYKIDWNNISQHGNNSASDPIGKNGGCIVQFRIEVVAHVRVNSSDDDKGSVSLKVNGEAIQGTETNVTANQTVVAVATPAENCVFMNWTDDVTNEVVSTDLEYTVTVSGDVSLTANFLTQEDFDNLPEDEAFDPKNITSTYNYKDWKGDPSTDRHLDSFRLTNGTGSPLNEPDFNVDQPRAPGSSLYRDLTEGDNTPIFQTQPGNTVRFDDITSATGWLHGYLFIDYNQDLPKGGGFNSKLNTTGYTLNNDAMKNSSLITVDDNKGELVSFSCFNLNTTGVDSNDNFVDSRGNSIPKTRNNDTDIYYGSGVTTETMPEFKIPEDLEPGIYDALFKTDWSDLSQHGNRGDASGKNIIGDNGGCIVRFQIEVVKPLYITGHTETNTSYWNAAVITLNYSATGIAEGEELVAVATQTGFTVLDNDASFTTLADEAAPGDDGDDDVIVARKVSDDGITLTFNLDKGQNQAQLLFEQPTWDENGNKTDNFTPNTQYTYDVVLKKVNAEGKATGESDTYNDLQFTTAAEKNKDTTAGVEDVTADDSNAPARYYNLQGIEVAQPAAGQVYIVRQGKTVKKVLVK